MANAPIPLPVVEMSGEAYHDIQIKLAAYTELAKRYAEIRTLISVLNASRVRCQIHQCAGRAYVRHRTVTTVAPKDTFFCPAHANNVEVSVVIPFAQEWETLLMKARLK